MRATLTFDLDDPDDKMAHMRAVKSLDLALAVWHLYHNSKVIDKFQMVTPEMYDIDEKWKETIQDILIEHGINIDELIN